MAANKLGGRHLAPYRFKKGEVANPWGRPALTEPQKALRRLTIESYGDIIETALKGTVDDLKAIVEYSNRPAIEVGVAACLIRAIEDGDDQVLERFAARIIGKIPDVIKVDMEGNLQTALLTGKIPDDVVRERLKKIRRDV